MIRTRGRVGPFSMSVPNFKQTALFIRKLLGVPNFWKWVTWPSHAHLWVVLYSVRWRDPSSISILNLKRIAQFAQKLLRGSQNLEIRWRYHLGVILWSARREGPSSMSVPNFKQIALFLPWGSQNFEIGSRDPGHAHFGVVLWSTRSRGPSCMSVPNLKHIAIRSIVIRGSQIFEIGHVIQATPT